jgi:UDP-glucose 4-epimerase
VSGKVLITGGAGFIGAHLAQRLVSEGFTVDLVDNFSRGVMDLELETLSCEKAVALYSIDCLDSQQVEALGVEYDYIFHLAAIIGVDHVTRQPYRVLVDNLRMTDNLVQLAIKQKGLKRFLYPSTSEVTAGSFEFFGLAIPTAEDAPLAVTELSRPRTSYMLSKINGESLCHYSGLPFTIFRPHNIYGPRMGLSHVVPGQLKKAYFAKDGDEVHVPSVEQTRSFCFVADAVEQLLRMMVRPEAEGQTLNLGTESPEVTILEVAQACHAAVGRKVHVKAEPAPPGSPARRAPDMTKTNAIIGFSSQVSLAEGVERTFSWYRDAVFEGWGVSAQ